MKMYHNGNASGDNNNGSGNNSILSRMNDFMGEEGEEPPPTLTVEDTTATTEDLNGANNEPAGQYTLNYHQQQQAAGNNGPQSANSLLHQGMMDVHYPTVARYPFAMANAGHEVPLYSPISGTFLSRISPSTLMAYMSQQQQQQQQSTAATYGNQQQSQSQAYEQLVHSQFPPGFPEYSPMTIFSPSYMYADGSVVNGQMNPMGGHDIFSQFSGGSNSAGSNSGGMGSFLSVGMQSQSASPHDHTRDCSSGSNNGDNMDDSNVAPPLPSSFTNDGRVKDEFVLPEYEKGSSPSQRQTIVARNVQAENDNLHAPNHHFAIAPNGQVVSFIPPPPPPSASIIGKKRKTYSASEKNDNDEDNDIDHEVGSNVTSDITEHDVITRMRFDGATELEQSVDFKIIQGFTENTNVKQPGGKGNRQPLPRFIIETDLTKCPDRDRLSEQVLQEKLVIEANLLGNKGSPPTDLGILSTAAVRTHVRKDETANVSKFTTFFARMVVKSSSHTNGRKLFVRFRLIDTERNVCLREVDSGMFETITKRGIEKQRKKEREGILSSKRRKTVSCIHNITPTVGGVLGCQLIKISGKFNAINMNDVCVTFGELESLVIHCVKSDVIICETPRIEKECELEIRVSLDGKKTFVSNAQERIMFRVVDTSMDEGRRQIVEQLVAQPNGDLNTFFK